MKHLTSLAGALLVLQTTGMAAAHAADPASGSDRRDLVVCLADANPPFSAADTRDGGINAEIARGIGRQLGREVRLSWVTIANRGGLGKALRQSLGAATCDIFPGIPVSGGSNEDLVELRLQASEPYLTTGYALLKGSRSSVRNLDDARKAARVGVVTATPADLYLHQQHMNRVPYGNNGDLLAALANGTVDAGLMWMPALANARQGGLTLWPEAIREERLAVSGLETRFVIALRPGEPDLKSSVDAALTRMQGDGALTQILERHGMARSSNTLSRANP
jgi:ABC-type amino acid transport substrate-binding protein